MKRRITILTSLFVLFFSLTIKAQTATDIVKQVKIKLDKVLDYEAKAKLKTNVIFIKVPVADVRIYFKRPNKLKIHNENGISFIPKGSVNISLGNLFANSDEYDVIDAGREASSGLRIIKLLPKEDSADVVLSTLYIDEKQLLIKKAKTTTKENGTYELEMTYGKYADYGLADKIIFLFNTKEYKLPKGVTFDYDVDRQKNKDDQLKNKKGRVEINYSEYIINKGVPDSIFQ